MVLPTGRWKDICWVVVNEFWMNFDWTIFRLFNNSVLLSSGCLKDHENLWIGGGFPVFLQISRGWAHSELGYLKRCDEPTWVQKYSQDADGVDGQTISPQLRREHPSSCTWQGMPGSEGGIPTLNIKWELTPHFPPILESGHVPFLWHCWNFSGIKFFFLLIIQIYFTGLTESAISSSSTSHCKRNSFQQTGQWKTNFV